MLMRCTIRASRPGTKVTATAANLPTCGYFVQRHLARSCCRWGWREAVQELAALARQACWGRVTRNTRDSSR